MLVCPHMITHLLVYISYAMGTCGLFSIYTLSPRASGPRASGVYTGITIMLNKNSLAVKKVRGQSEATMVISDQKL